MASFTISESPILPRVQSTNSSPRCASSRDWDEFSSALLDDGFVLTALELYTELLECGKEVPSLRDYFSNPGNFEHAIPQPPSGILHSSMSERVIENSGTSDKGQKSLYKGQVILPQMRLSPIHCLCIVNLLRRGHLPII